MSEGISHGAAHHGIRSVVGKTEPHKFELGRVEIARLGAKRVDKTVDSLVVERKFVASVVRGEGDQTLLQLRWISLIEVLILRVCELGSIGAGSKQLGVWRHGVAINVDTRDRSVLG
ncbi:hypothetical protein HG531_006063 [Fusarium graminearum]|nr:hypothetical protein HG531_006063 [Fusarium graminearum]